ncbi:MAG: ATP-binding cassette domain-containing protein, partial [Candidatus Korobacteraceae bacterium]
MSQLSVRIRKSFGGERGSLFALDVEFSAAAGFTILFGASGAGKTTLLDCIAGLQTPETGRIAVGTNALFDSSGGVDIPPNRRAVGYLLQTLALFPHMTVAQNVQYGLDRLERSEREARCAQVLEAFRIAALAD